MEEKAKFDPLKHKNYSLDMENTMLKLVKEKHEMPFTNGDSFPGGETVYAELISMVEAIPEDTGKDSTPEQILKSAFSHLQKVDQKRFVLENMLEGIKRGDKIDTLTKNYQDLGLMTPPPLNSSTININTPTLRPGLGDWLWKIITGPLKKIAIRLMAMIQNALCGIPQFINIKPIVGFTGIFPSLSFQLDADDMNLHEFWEMLMGN